MTNGPWQILLILTPVYMIANDIFNTREEYAYKLIVKERATGTIRKKKKEKEKEKTSKLGEKVLRTLTIEVFNA